MAKKLVKKPKMTAFDHCYGYQRSVEGLMMFERTVNARVSYTLIYFTKFVSLYSNKTNYVTT